MKKTILEKGLVVYSFDPIYENEFVSYNVMTLQHNEEVLIIDTAFKRHFDQIVEDLNKENKKITNVITTHFHKDHIGGLDQLNDAKKYASINCEKTISLVFNDNDYSAYLPDVYVDEYLKLSFGDFKVELFTNPGHSVDGLLVIINDKYINAGDEILFTSKQIPLLPFAADGDIEAHISSLEFIQSKVSGSTLIPAHGNFISDDTIIIGDILNRIEFLTHKQENESITSEQFEAETGIYFFGYPWYAKNV